MASFLKQLLNFVFPVTCAGCGADLAVDDRYRLCPACFDSLPLIDGLVCVTCGKPLPDGGEHCYACRQDTKRHFAAIRSAGEYKGLLRDLIHSFKFRNRDYLDRILGKLLIVALEKYRFSDEVDCIIPVPMHPLKRLMRGYNQAELLADQVAEYLQKPVVKSLRRNRLTHRQYLLKKTERAANLKGAFTVGDPSAVKGKRVLVVDDICTTCATIEHCAVALRKAGAASVCGLTVARD